MEKLANYKMLFLSIAGGLVGIAYYFSMIGLGLPTQNDPLSIRQESATNGRPFQGGTRTFGK